MKPKRRKLVELRRINISITPEDHQWLTTLAVAKGTSVSYEISQIVQLAKEKKYGKEELDILKQSL